MGKTLTGKLSCPCDVLFCQAACSQWGKMASLLSVFIHLFIYLCIGGDVLLGEHTIFSTKHFQFTFVFSWSFKYTAYLNSSDALVLSHVQIRYFNPGSIKDIVRCKKNYRYEPKYCDLSLKRPLLQKDQYANSVDLAEAAHNELPQLDLHCLPSSLWILRWYNLDKTFFEIWQTYCS